MRRDEETSDRIPRIEWLDWRDETSESKGTSILSRIASFGGGAWMLLRPVVVYLAIPCLFLLVLVTVCMMLPVHPVIGGIIFSIALALGLTFYLDEIVN